MKLFLRSTIIATLSLCCIQIISSQQQPVVAKKKKLTDIKTVTVTITDRDNNQISESTFRKNSTPPARKLFFDFSNGSNTVTVSYKDSPTPISKTFEKRQVPAGSEIVLDNKDITINRKKAKAKEISEIEMQAPKSTGTAPRATASPAAASSASIAPSTSAAPVTLPRQQSSSGLSQQQTANTIKAIVQPPKRTSWRMVSGPTSLTSDIAEARIDGSSSSDSVLESGLYAVNPRKSLLIYKDKDTNIYAKKYGAGMGQMTTLTQADIVRAGNRPYILLDEKGNATVVDGNKVF